jgi:hypothetical protein
MAAPIVNRRVRADGRQDERLELSLRATGHGLRLALASERPAPAPPPAPLVATEAPWEARVDILTGIETAFRGQSPDAAGVELRAVAFPPGSRWLASVAFGFEELFAWPPSRAGVSGYALDAAVRFGARFRSGWISLEPTMGVGLAYHLLKLDTKGATFSGGALPNAEIALGLGVGEPWSVRVDLGLLWAPWALHVVAPAHGLDALIGGVTARMRVGVGFDFL